MTKFDVNTDGVIWFTNQLEKMHQSAFPNAVRGTLNSLAFDVKQKTMPLQVQKDFTIRNKTFFKANSRVEKATGFKVNSMHSIVGFKAHANTKNNKAIDELEQQEFGGVIKDRKLIPLKGSRIGGKGNRKVQTKNRLSKLKASQIRKSSKRSFVKDVHKAGRGGYIRTDKSILLITSIRKNVFKFKRIYKINNSSTVKVDKTGFMKKASVKSLPKAELFYISEAQRQFERYYNS
jgi:hypothetical protein